MPHALITGANRGLGLEHCRQLLERGWTISAAVRDPSAASELKALDPGEGRLNLCAYDASDVSAAVKLAEQVTGPIDLLFANAGMMSRETRNFGTAGSEHFISEMRVNALAPLALAEAFADQVVRHHQALFLNSLDLYGERLRYLRAYPRSGGYVYYTYYRQTQLRDGGVCTDYDADVNALNQLGRDQVEVSRRNARRTVRETTAIDQNEGTDRTDTAQVQCGGA